MTVRGAEATETRSRSASPSTATAVTRESATAGPAQLAIPWPGEKVALTKARAEMVKFQMAARGIKDAEVLRAMGTVPRHLFVPEQHLDAAYADHPLPIGFGQTISQPYVVALMTELLQLEGHERVLEIGTGSGYQAAVLAELLPKVYTVEIIPELAAQAQARLSALGYDNAHVLAADGYFGWVEFAPFDAIIVTAAPDQLPPPLVEQLAASGRLVIPIGPQGGLQVLWQFVNEDEGLTGYRILDVRFVPFTRVVKSAPE